MTNHYNILGVRENATPEEIKEAYRKRALETHPDRTGNEEAREEFLQVQAAYETLSNPRDRARFDRQLKQDRRRTRSRRARSTNGREKRSRRHVHSVHQVRRRSRSSRFTAAQRSGRMPDPSDLPPGTLKYGMLAIGIAAIGYGLFGPALVVFLILSVIGVVSLVCIVDILDDLVLGGRLKDLF